MTDRLTTRRERQLRSAERLYGKGRGHIVWINGALFFGGSLFLLYNTVDYLIDPKARATPVEMAWFFTALACSGLIGYLYGRFTWRNLVRTFASVSDSNLQNVQ
jgi:hypothetical protein